VPLSALWIIIYQNPKEPTWAVGAFVIQGDGPKGANSDYRKGKKQRLRETLQDVFDFKNKNNAEPQEDEEPGLGVWHSEMMRKYQNETKEDLMARVNVTWRHEMTKYEAEDAEDETFDLNTFFNTVHSDHEKAQRQVKEKKLKADETRGKASLRDGYKQWLEQKVEPNLILHETIEAASDFPAELQEKMGSDCAGTRVWFVVAQHETNFLFPTLSFLSACLRSFVSSSV
jgi:hypothetical protein